MNLYLKYKDVSDLDSFTEKTLFDTFGNHLASFQKYATIMSQIGRLRGCCPSTK